MNDVNDAWQEIKCLVFPAFTVYHGFHIKQRDQTYIIILMNIVLSPQGQDSDEIPISFIWVMYGFVQYLLIPDILV